MRTLFKIVAYLLLVVFLLLSVWLFFETVSWLVLENYRLYMWFGIGVGAYIVLRRIPFLRKNAEWFETQTHEWIHTIVALIFGRRIHFVGAGQDEGVVYHSGRLGRNIFISLAPYCFPIYTLFFCILRLLGAQEWLHIFDLMIGLTLAFHLVAFMKQTRPYQPDLRVFSLATSYIFIVAFLLFNLMIVLLTVKMGIGSAFVYLAEQYWGKLQYVYGFLIR